MYIPCRTGHTVFMNHKSNLYLNNFIKCGIAGWCLEILFTASMALRRREMTFFLRMQKLAFPVRGCIYALMIFAGEFLSGRLLQKHHLCPWDYTSHHWNIQGIIRLDFFPYWFATGLFFEKLLTEKPSSQSKG